MIMASVPESVDHATAPPRPLETLQYHGAGQFLTLGDGVVRRLLDALSHLDLLRGVLDDSDSSSAQMHTAHGQLSDLLTDLETHIRVTNAAMLDITSAWPTPASGRPAPAPSSKSSYNSALDGCRMSK